MSATMPSQDQGSQKPAGSLDDGTRKMDGEKTGAIATAFTREG